MSSDRRDRKMGKLIVIEGLDGAGKNTQSDLLKERLEAMGKKVMKIDFPDYDSDASVLVRMYLGGKLGNDPSDTGAYAASTFYACDRYVSYVTKWKEFYLEEDSVVIANRYTTANSYHQLSKLPREEWDSFLDWLWDFEFSKLGLPTPDRVVCLTVPVSVSVANIEKRCAEKSIKKDIHEADVAYLQSCYDAANYVANKMGWLLIDCMRDGTQMSVSEIGEMIFEGCGLAST